MRCNSKTANYVYCHFCFAGCSWLACLPKEAEKEGKRGPAAPGGRAGKKEKVVWRIGQINKLFRRNGTDTALLNHKPKGIPHPHSTENKQVKKSN